MNLKNSSDSTGFEPMTSTMPVQCSNQLNYEVTQLRGGQFVGLMTWSQLCDFVAQLVRALHRHLQFVGLMACSQLCDFVAQLVRALHRHCRGHGFESR